MSRSRFPRVLAPAVAAVVVAVAGCGGGDGDGDRASPSPGTTTIEVLTHDSFAVSDDVLAAFTDQTGIEVKRITGGDAGSVVNQAILSAGNPQADVLFGVDSTFLGRALDADLFEPHEAAGLEQVDPRYVLDPRHRVTPVDYGDVCVNYDKAYFAEHDLPVPRSLADLTDPAYRDLLVVENPATSSPGLAFLLATVAELGPDGWQGYWRALRANGVEVAQGWEDAYYGSFSGGSGSEGERPLVVSYASSPPAEVVYADPPVSESPIGVVEDGCYRQVEMAGVLRGTRHPEAAGRFVDFLISEPFQSDVALSMFVFPVRRGVELPEVFTDYAARPAHPATLPPDQVEARREEWIDEWTRLVVR